MGDHPRYFSRPCRWGATGFTGCGHILLYFEPTSVPLYVDLHNTTDIYMNSIEVDIVKIDESPADDLTGRTVVVLHIRQKQK